MPWRGPEFEGEFPSLGYVLLEWMERYLRVPSGELYGQPLRLTDEQARIVVRFYGLTPTGEWLYRRGSVRRPQGWGKSPLLAGVALAELAGPVVFDGWDADGEPVGRLHSTPWVQIAAVSEDQTDNTYVALYQSLEGSDSADELGLDVGLTRVHRKNSPGRLEPVTSSAGSRLGQPVTFAVLDETHLWVPSNGGQKLAATIRRNTAKVSGRTFETTNAYRPGDGSVAEDSHRAAKEGAKGLLYDAREPEPIDDLRNRKALRKALVQSYGDSSAWVDLDRIVEEVQDPATDPIDARRFYLNQIVAVADAWVEPALWQALNTNERISPGETVVLGFDGGATDDSTALVAVRVSDGLCQLLGCWEKPLEAREWQVPREEVDAAFVEAMHNFRVVRAYVDPPYWREELARWSHEFADSGVAAWETYRAANMSRAVEATETAISTGVLKHSTSATLDRHVTNARRRRSRWGDTVAKDAERSPRKIDAAVALILAWQARLDAMSNELKPVTGPPSIYDPWSADA